MSNFLNSCKEYITNITTITTGNILIILGTHTQEVAAIVITLGALLLICRKTKVLRYGVLSYFLGLLIELIGSSLIK